MLRGTALWMFLGSLFACDRVARPSTEGASRPDFEGVQAPYSQRVGPAGSAGAGGAARPLDPRSVAVLRDALGSKDYATRLVAVEAMGEAKLEIFVPALEHTLGDPEHDVRMAALEALEASGSPQAKTILATVRDDATEALDIRAVAAGALLRTTP